MNKLRSGSPSVGWVGRAWLPLVLLLASLASIAPVFPAGVTPAGASPQKFSGERARHRC